MAAFTTIAALGMSAAGSAFSFIQAGKQAQVERDANKAAAQALAEAKKKLEVNMLSGLSIAKEPYELEREALLQQGASALQAGIEGETRGAAAVAGQALMAQQAGAAGQRAAMSREMADLDLLKAQEDVNLQGQRVGLDLGEAQGQQMRAADARAARAQAIQAGVEGLVDVGLGAMENRRLYADTTAGREGRLGRRAGRIAKRDGDAAGKAFLNKKRIDYTSLFPEPKKVKRNRGV
tara:strand:+ start:1020 stop:1727 length:708 start_codon:yes stop_codon:yes gene_type:complete